MKDGYNSDASTFAESMQVNATGLFMITRAFGEVMAQQGGGSIIMIGSMMGTVGPDWTYYVGTSASPWYPDYFFHKGGMVNFTRYVAGHYGQQNVRCNCINPGGFQTEKHEERFLQQYGERTMLGRMANAHDLKGIVVLLALRRLCVYHRRKHRRRRRLHSKIMGSRHRKLESTIGNRALFFFARVVHRLPLGTALALGRLLGRIGAARFHPAFPHGLR